MQFDCSENISWFVLSGYWFQKFYKGMSIRFMYELIDLDFQVLRRISGQFSKFLIVVQDIL